MDKRRAGRIREDAAADYIEQKGAKILCRNFRSRMGEIDIIASDGGTICFIEVKYRWNISSGYTEEAVGIKKMHTICRTADYYRMVRSLPENMSYRFDVISITGDSLTWHKNAFSYIPYG